jgi:TetR/AcrR family tetracycline transcriptional repressor
MQVSNNGNVRPLPSPDTAQRSPAAANDEAVSHEPATLSRTAVLQTAVEFIDRHGLAMLTMRRLGAMCGVEAMALYRYVHGRGDLLNGVVDHLLDRLYADQLAARRHEDSWQDYLTRLAHGTRRIALQHPQVFPLIATQPPQAPWLRPPLRSLRWLDTFLDTLKGYGFTDAAAVAAYRLYTTFLLGHLLLDVSALGAPLHAEEAVLEDAAQHASADTAQYRHVHRLQALLSHDHSATDFDESLHALLHRLDPLRTPSPAT